jgi:hypothetical protein
LLGGTAARTTVIVERAVTRFPALSVAEKITFVTPTPNVSGASFVT